MGQGARQPGVPDHHADRPAPSVDRVLPLPFHGQRGQHVQLFARDTLFSLLNADVLIKGEKLSNKVLDVLAKTNCVLLFLWAAATIVHVLVK